MTEKTFSNSMGNDDWAEYFTDNTPLKLDSPGEAWHETDARMRKALSSFIEMEIESDSPLAEFISSALIAVMFETSRAVGINVLNDTDYEIEDLVIELQKRVKISDEIADVSKVTKEEEEFWGTAFTELVGWLYHPGYNREGTPKPTLEEIADTVTEMVVVRRKRLSKGVENEN